MSSSKRCSPGWDKLSEDLIYEILLCLPVKSLLRFKTVSKVWCCIISSPGFVESHYARPGSYAETKLIVHDRYSKGRFSLLQPSPSPVITDLQFPYPGCKSSYKPRIIGSDRGIVCVTVCDDSGPERSLFDLAYSGMCSTHLWNPASNHYKVIPPKTRLYRSSYFRSWNVDLGFGFDPISNDFKVIRVVNSSSECEVYSANLNAWRKVGRKPTKIGVTCLFKGVINGLLCWTGSHHILTFDLSKEVFTCVTMPSSESKHTHKLFSEPGPAHITDFNDSIVLIIGKGYNGKINLWTSDDAECFRDGGVVEASWTLMLSIEIDVPVHSILSYFNCGDILLMSDDANCFSYNSVQKVLRKFPNTICWDEIFKYTESLVSITGFEPLKFNVGEDGK